MNELTPEQRAELLERHLYDHGHVHPEDIDATQRNAPTRIRVWPVAARRTSS